MEAGRELDALVAERVMGITKPEHFVPKNIWLPHYSTSIEHAWAVVEKIADKNILVGRYYDKWVCSNVCSDVWGCYFDEPKRYEQMNDHNFFEQADTAPHAICLAALKAIEAP